MMKFLAKVKADNKSTPSDVADSFVNGQFSQMIEQIDEYLKPPRPMEAKVLVQELSGLIKVQDIAKILAMYIDKKL